MLWAIDIGNTQTVVGVHDEGIWKAVWRLETDPHKTEDELAVILTGLCQLDHLPFKADGVVYASVVPALNTIWEALAADRLGCLAKKLERGSQVGLEVVYEPPHAVGADRIANAIAALKLYAPPIVVVDFGTATTFDVIDGAGRYLGGAILPGVTISLEALTSRTAKLPSIELKVPESAIGKNTIQAIESGVLWGYAGSVNEIAKRITEELGAKPKIISTGGLGRIFLDLSDSIEEHLPNLTLDGLVLFAEMAS